MSQLSGRILAIDDMEENLLVYSHMFKDMESIDLVCVSSGQIGINKLREEEFDVILLDVEMPGLDGYESAMLIRQIPKAKTIPIIFVTANYEIKKFKEKGFEVGAVDFLTRPLDKNLLINRINVYLELARSRKELQKYSEKLELIVDERTKNLLVAADKAETASRFKSEFLSNMSHEMRTPLHAILTLSRRGLTKFDDLEKEKLKFYFAQIRECGEKMLELVDNLLDLNKFDLHRNVFNFEPCYIGKLTQEIISEFQTIFSEKNINIEINLLEKDVSIVVDKKQLSVVMRHLINNALQYGGEKNYIKIKIIKLENKISWKIFDKGFGVPPDEKEKIFEPFNQSSYSKSKAGGKGLGLSICREIIKMHDGSISVNEEMGETCFAFHLPIKVI